MPQPRPVVVPPDLQAALDADPAAKTAFDRLSSSHRCKHAQYVDEAKLQETRDRRTERTLHRLKGR